MSPSRQRWALVAAAGCRFPGFESRHDEPMLPLDFFRVRQFTVANSDYALMYAALTGMLLRVAVLPERQGLLGARDRHLLDDDERSVPARLAPCRSPPGAVWDAAGRLRGRSARRARCPQLRAARYGLVVRQAVPGYPLVGLGYGTAAPAISAVAMGAIGVERAGVASGVLNTARQVGSAVGLAARGSIAAAVAAGPLRDADDLCPACGWRCWSRAGSRWPRAS
jgi:hypothetical protein